MSRKERRVARKLGNLATAPASDIQPLFGSALRQHQAGQLAEAERLYHAVLEQTPKHELSLYHLGLIALQQGRPQPAEPGVSSPTGARER